MALRIDFFSVEPNVDLERSDLTALVGADARPDGAGARWEGHVAASDTDEGALVELATIWSQHGVLDGVGVQGVSETPQEVVAHDAIVLMELDDTTIAALCGDVTPVGQVREWANVALHCVTESVATSRHIGWWTRYDTGGSSDSGADEWPTGSSIRELG